MILDALSFLFRSLLKQVEVPSIDLSERAPSGSNFGGYTDVLYPSWDVFDGARREGGQSANPQRASIFCSVLSELGVGGEISKENRLFVIQSSVLLPRNNCVSYISDKYSQ